MRNLLLAAVFGGILGAGLVAAIRPLVQFDDSQPLPVVTAKEFVLTYGDGALAGSWRVTNGAPILMLIGPDGKAKVTLTVDKIAGAAVLLTAPDERSRCMVKAKPGGQASIELMDENLTTRGGLMMGSSGDCQLSLFNAAGKMTHTAP